MPETASAPRAPVAASKLPLANPFRGLRRFELEDSPLFFGRDEQIYDVLRRLRQLHFVAVLGPSGSGKSSLIRAGVLAALRDGYMANDAPWRIVTMQPGNGPLEAWLAALRPLLRAGAPEDLLLTDPVSALDAQDGKIVILVDQFEELFQYSARTGKDRDVRSFLQAMLSAASGKDGCAYIMMTMRTEYLAQCADYPNLAEAINEGLYLVPVMTREQMRQAIVMPIRKIGAEITAPLVDRLLNDATGQTDALPVLQHALMRMWAKKRAWEPLGLPEYQAQVHELSLGLPDSKAESAGIGAFISAHAAEVTARLKPGQAEIAKNLFQAITELTEDGRAVRRARTLAEIAQTTGISEDRLKPVVDAFQAAGFVNVWRASPIASPLVDLSHEAVARQWPDLRNWMTEELRLKRTMRRLNDAGKDWNEHKRDKGYLFRGLQLAEANFILQGRESGLDPITKAFIQSSRDDARLSLFLSRKVFPFIVGLTLFVLALVYIGLSFARIAQSRKLEAAVEKQAAESNLNNARKAQTEYAAVIRSSGGATDNGFTAATPVPQSVSPAVAAPRVYIQILNEDQRAQARDISKMLRSQGFVVPAVEKVAIGPSTVEVRCFRKKDEGKAGQITKSLRSIQVPARWVYVPGFETSDTVRDGHFELWLPTGKS